MNTPYHKTALDVLMDSSEDKSGKPVTSDEIEARLAAFLLKRDGVVPKTLKPFVALSADQFAGHSLTALLRDISERPAPDDDSSTGGSPAALSFFGTTQQTFADMQPSDATKLYDRNDPVLDAIMHRFIRYAKSFGEFPRDGSAHKAFLSEKISAYDMHLIASIEADMRTIATGYEFGPLDLIDTWIIDQADKFRRSNAGNNPDISSGQVDGYGITWREINQCLLMRHFNKINLQILLETDLKKTSAALDELRGIEANEIEPHDIEELQSAGELEPEVDFNVVLTKPTYGGVAQIVSDPQYIKHFLQQPKSSLMVLLDAIELIGDENERRAAYSRFKNSSLYEIICDGSETVRGYLQSYEASIPHAKDTGGAVHLFAVVAAPAATPLPAPAAPVVLETAIRVAPAVQVYSAVPHAGIVHEPEKSVPTKARISAAELKSREKPEFSFGEDFITYAAGVLDDFIRYAKQFDTWPTASAVKNKPEPFSSMVGRHLTWLKRTPFKDITGFIDAWLTVKGREYKESHNGLFAHYHSGWIDDSGITWGWADDLCGKRRQGALSILEIQKRVPLQTDFEFAARVFGKKTEALPHASARVSGAAEELRPAPD